MTKRGTQPASMICGEAIFESCADGSQIVRSAREPGPYPNRVTECLQCWAEPTPANVVLAERSGGGWRTVTYRVIKAE